MNQAHPHFMEFEVHITEALLFWKEFAFGDRRWRWGRGSWGGGVGRGLSDPSTSRPLPLGFA